MMDPSQHNPQDRYSLHDSKLPGFFTRVVSLFSGKGARDGYLAAADQAVISLSNFVATIILARQVSPTELGVYGVGFTALRLIRSVQDGLTVQPLNAFGAPMGEEDFRRYATSTTLIQIALAIASAVAVASVGWGLIVTGNDVAGPTLFHLWFAVFGFQLQEYIRRILYTRGAVLDAVVNSFLANAFRLALLAWWAIDGELSGVAGLHAIAWGSLAALLPGVWQTRRFWCLHFDDLRSTWKRNWEFGRWVMGGAVSNWVATEFYPILTAGMISFAAAGAYRALQNLVSPIQVMLRATDTFLTPRAARTFSEKGQAGVNRLMRLTYLITVTPVLAVLGLAMLFPEQLLHLLYGDTYIAYAPGIVLMALYYALWFIYWPLQTAFKALRRSQPIFVANLTAIVVMFTVGIWMITRWGVLGTIGGQVLNALVLTLIHWQAWLTMRKSEQQ